MTISRKVLERMVCRCEVCARHHEAHLQATLASPFGDVSVDAEMQPLLQFLNDRGIPTVGSCIDVADAVQQLSPGLLRNMVAVQQPRVNYRRVVMERWAFVRVFDLPAAAPFLEAVQATGGEVLRTSEPLLAQAAFPRWQAHTYPSLL